jgi:hypothetical protein
VLEYLTSTSLGYRHVSRFFSCSSKTWKRSIWSWLLACVWRIWEKCEVDWRLMRDLWRFIWRINGGLKRWRVEFFSFFFKEKWGPQLSWSFCV